MFITCLLAQCWMGQVSLNAAVLPYRSPTAWKICRAALYWAGLPQTWVACSSDLAGSRASGDAWHGVF